MYFNPYHRKFTLFARLPPEVQNMVWQIAVNDIKPRIVEVRVMSNARRSTYLRRKQFTSTSSIPGILQTCRASRSLALRRWKLSFGARYEEPKIFFDLSCDTLFFPPGFGHMKEFVDSVSYADRAALKKLAFNITDRQNCEYYYHSGWYLGTVLDRDFPALTELIFPEEDINAQREESAGERRAKRLRSRRRLFNTRRRKRSISKPDPRKMIITWYGGMLPRRPENWIFIVLRMLDARYRDLRSESPQISRIDFIKKDIACVEFDEDQDRLDRAEAKREFEKVWARHQAPLLEEEEEEEEEEATRAGAGLLLALKEE